MHWRCTKHWLHPNRSCLLKKACHEISQAERRLLTVPEWISLHDSMILSRLHWAHSRVVRTWTNSPSWLPLVASGAPVCHVCQSSAAAVISQPRTERSCQLQRQICELVLEKGENDDLLAWWASSPHRWSLQNFKTLYDWNTGHLGWVRSKMVFSCNMQTLVLPLQERFRQTYITKPKPVRVLHAAPIALLRNTKASTRHDRVFSSTPHQGLWFYQAHLQTAVLTHLYKAAGLEIPGTNPSKKQVVLLMVDTTKLYHCTSLLQPRCQWWSRVGRQTLHDKTSHFHCQDRLRRLRVYYLFTL